MRFPIHWVLVLILAGCSASSRPAFRVEPNYRFTFGPERALPVGAILRFSFTGIKPSETFLVNRCGTPCNTSKVVASVSGAEPPEGDVQLRIQESGEYYLWIQKQLENGETGPVSIDTLESSDTTFSATFSGGTVVTGAMELLPDSSQGRAAQNP